jgi:formate hydrogenlyase subunit 3/multisubunit Na+/H+ antiporter MnhD subunit
MSPVTAVAGVVSLIGLAALSVLAWAARKVMWLDRSVDAGDVAVLSVLALFGAFCLYVGGWLFRDRSYEVGSPTMPVEKPPRRVTLSQGFATAGVVLLMLCVLVPEHWYPVLLLFLGLALLAVSHVLTPCEERLARLRRARASIRQL